MSKYSEETKAAVMAALLTGQSVSSISKDYNLPEGTVRSWKSRQLNGESVAIVATEKKAQVGELLIDY
jgi:transposase-like protein